MAAAAASGAFRSASHLAGGALSSPRSARMSVLPTAAAIDNTARPSGRGTPGRPAAGGFSSPPLAGAVGGETPSGNPRRDRLPVGPPMAAGAGFQRLFGRGY